MSVQRVLEFDHFFCDTCRKFVYNELEGDSDLHLPPKTRIDDLSEFWKCPVCGASKDKLRAVTLVDEYAHLTETPELIPIYSEKNASRSELLTGSDRNVRD